MNIINFGQEFAEILDDIIVILGLIATILGILYGKNRVEKDQLTKTIDKSPIQNEDFKELAKKQGWQLGAKIIGKLITKK